MPYLTDLQSDLTSVSARITEIETAFPDILDAKGQSHGFGVLSHTNQDFDGVSKEFRALLAKRTQLRREIASLTGETISGVTSLATSY